MVDKVRRYTPRPRQAAQEAIEAYILKNQMKANDKFPPERTMCQMWGLNRSTLRSTLARMARDGRVHAVQGSGTCFTPRVDRVLQDLKSFTQYAADLGMKPETRLLGLSWWSVINNWPGVFSVCWAISCTVSSAFGCWTECLL